MRRGRAVSRRGLLACAGAGALAASAPPAAGQEDRRIRIGTASLLGVYFPIGSAICRRLAEARGTDGRHCTELATAGSVYNLQSLRRGGMELAVAQSDVAFQAASGTGAFAGEGPDRELRAVLRVLTEPFTVVSRGLFAPTSFAALRGRRVGIGLPGSGQFATFKTVLAAAGWSERDLVAVTDYDTDQQSFALCDGLIDAFVLVAAGPSPAVGEAVARCEARLVPIEDELIEAVVRGRPYYRRMTIPAGAYPDNPEPIPTFGTEALLLAAAATPVGIVQDVVAAVLGDVARFRRLHLAFAAVTAESLVPDLDFLPLHEGARRWFQQAGLV